MKISQRQQAMIERIDFKKTAGLKIHVLKQYEHGEIYDVSL